MWHQPFQDAQERGHTIIDGHKFKCRHAWAMPLHMYVIMRVNMTFHLSGEFAEFFVLTHPGVWAQSQARFGIHLVG